MTFLYSSLTHDKCSIVDVDVVGVGKSKLDTRIVKKVSKEFRSDGFYLFIYNFRTKNHKRLKVPNS